MYEIKIESLILSSSTCSPNIITVSMQLLQTQLVNLKTCQNLKWVFD